MGVIITAMGKAQLFAMGKVSQHKARIGSKIIYFKKEPMGLFEDVESVLTYSPSPQGADMKV